MVFLVFIGMDLGNFAATLAALLVAVFHETKNIVKREVEKNALSLAELGTLKLSLESTRDKATELSSALVVERAARGLAETACLEKDAALKKERENLDGCPRIILGYLERTEFGFFVAASAADGIGVQIEPVRSPHYKLTSNCIPHAANGIPQCALELHVELTVEEPGYIKSAEGQEAWSVFAADLWHMKRPLQSAETPEKMFTEFVNAAANENLVIPLRIAYRDLAGKCYASTADVVWEPLLGSVVEIRPGAIQKVPC